LKLVVHSPRNELLPRSIMNDLVLWWFRFKVLWELSLNLSGFWSNGSDDSHVLVDACYKEHLPALEYLDEDVQCLVLHMFSSKVQARSSHLPGLRSVIKGRLNKHEHHNALFVLVDTQPYRTIE
jgi:hypothetical protein